MKRVTVGINMDEQFIRILDANVCLSNLRKKDELDPAQQLALLVLTEARGGTEEQVHASILHTWRPNIEAVSKLRKVYFESYKPRKKQAVHWTWGWGRGKTRTFCGSSITKTMDTTDNKQQVTCRRCLACMRLHDHLVEGNDGDSSPIS